MCLSKASSIPVHQVIKKIFGDNVELDGPSKMQSGLRCVHARLSQERVARLFRKAFSNELLYLLLAALN